MKKIYSIRVEEIFSYFGWLYLFIYFLSFFLKRITIVHAMYLERVKNNKDRCNYNERKKERERGIVLK